MSESHLPENKERPIPAAWTKNPFQAPTAHVEDVRPDSDGPLLGEPNRVGAGRGSAWWHDGWGLFREATGLWIGISVTYIVLIVLLSKIAFVGPLFTYLLMPLVSGGLMLGCRSLQTGDGLSFGHLFAGFQQNSGQLILIGVLNLVGIFVIGLVVALVIGGGIGVATIGGNFGRGAAASTIIIGVVLGLGLGIPLAMSIWFAPALVILNDLPAIKAMKLSFIGCLHNMLPFLLWGIIGFVLAIIASIPIALGWLLLVPTINCSIYVAYRDIFLD
ncbi:BPSS1780 family membrane protein [Propionivibrio sp.]|uniref:BPSS1780 family membrane protein n=1 Tax=Propionivibrio sp. TaxID=2212460 RepID=UPI002614C39F|nr:BPSS1780 family membrane protein [Propionivibrio sp.]